MATILGKDCKLFRNTGTYASPTWTEVTNVKDVQFKRDAASADTTTRANGGYRAEEPTLKTLELTFKMVYDPADTDVTALKTAFNAGTSIEFAIASGAIATSGTVYTRASMKIHNFSQSENLEEAAMIDVTAKVCRSANAPSEVTTT